MNKLVFRSIIICLLLTSTIQDNCLEKFVHTGLGHDNLKTSFIESSIPNNPEILWKTDRLESGPITVADGRIFFCCFNYSIAWLFHVCCYNESDGTMIWRKPFRWKYDWPAFGLPLITVFKGRLYFTHAEILYCLDESTGWIIWETPPIPVPLGERFSPPIVDGLRIFVLFGRDRPGCFAFNMSNGETLWGVGLEGSETSVTSFTVSDKFVLINSYSSNITYTKCFDKENGALLWTHTYNFFPISAPSVAYEKVFLGLKSSIYTLDIFSGNIVWNSSIQGDITSTPVLANEKVFVGSTYYLYSINQETGDILWTYPIPGATFIAILDGKVYAYAGSMFYCLNEIDGSFNWYHELEAYWTGPYGNIRIANDNIYLSINGYIYAYGEKIVTAHSSISLELSQPSVTLPLEISGTINPPRNGTVDIQWSVDEIVWYSIKVTAFNGRYSYTWKSPYNGTIYIKSLWEGDNLYTASTSPVKTIVTYAYEQGSDYAKLKSEYEDYQNTHNYTNQEFTDILNDRNRWMNTYNSLNATYIEYIQTHHYNDEEYNNLLSANQNISIVQNLNYVLIAVSVILVVAIIYFVTKKK